MITAGINWNVRRIPPQIENAIHIAENIGKKNIASEARNSNNFNSWGVERNQDCGGIIHPDISVDPQFHCGEFREYSGGYGVTFHRALKLAPVLKTSQ
jgi:hypothetical protein